MEPGKTDLLKRSLVQQVTIRELLAGTEHAATNEALKSLRENLGHYPLSLETGSRNLLRAWQAGVTLATGSDISYTPVIRRR